MGMSGKNIKLILEIFIYVIDRILYFLYLKILFA